MVERLVVDVTRRYRRPPKASLVVDTAEGKVLGWQRGEEFVPAGQPCCEDPLRCRKCFGPVAPWWALWRR